MNQTNETSRRPRGRAAAKDRGTGRIKLYALMLVCATVVVSGFFFAARQHFSSMDYAMRNSRLRKQLDDLQSEKRRLLVAREVSLSPTEIKKAIQKLGIGESTSPEPVQASIAKDVKAKPDLVAATASAKAVSAPAATYAVTKTAMTMPVTKPQRIVKVAKRDPSEKPRKDKS